MTIEVNTNKELEKQNEIETENKFVSSSYKKININFHDKKEGKTVDINYSNLKNLEKNIRLKNKYKQLEYLTDIKTKENEEYHFLNNSLGKNYFNQNENKQDKKTLFSKNQKNIQNHFETLFLSSLIKEQEQSFEGISEYIKNQYLNFTSKNLELFAENFLEDDLNRKIEVINSLFLLHLLSFNNYFKEKISLTEIFNSKNKTYIFQQYLINFISLNQEWIKDKIRQFNLNFHTKETFAVFFHFLGVYHEVKLLIFEERYIEYFDKKIEQNKDLKSEQCFNFYRFYDYILPHFEAFTKEYDKEYDKEEDKEDEEDEQAFTRSLKNHLFVNQIIKNIYSINLYNLTKFNNNFYDYEYFSNNIFVSYFEQRSHQFFYKFLLGKKTSAPYNLRALMFFKITLENLWDKDIPSDVLDYLTEFEDYHENEDKDFLKRTHFVEFIHLFKEGISETLYYYNEETESLLLDLMEYYTFRDGRSTLCLLEKRAKFKTIKNHFIKKWEKLNTFFKINNHYYYDVFHDRQSFQSTLEILNDLFEYYLLKGLHIDFKLINQIKILEEHKYDKHIFNNVLSSLSHFKDFIEEKNVLINPFNVLLKDIIDKENICLKTLTEEVKAEYHLNHISDFTKNHFAKKTNTFKKMQAFLEYTKEGIKNLSIEERRILNNHSFLNRYFNLFLDDNFSQNEFFYHQSIEENLVELYEKLPYNQFFNFHHLFNDIKQTYFNIVNSVDNEDDEGCNSKTRVAQFFANLNQRKYLKTFINTNQELIKKLNKLKYDFPHFSNVVDYYSSQFLLNKQYNNIKPILLLGEAGVGKTKFINQFSKILGISSEIFHCPLITSTFTLSGLSSSYKGSKAGNIFKQALNSENANFVIALDEIDKIDYNIKNILYSLLETESSKKFYDEFVNDYIDISKAIIISTANNLEDFNEALLSRFEIFKIEMPDNNKIHQIMDSNWKSIFKHFPLLKTYPFLNNEINSLLTIDIKKEFDHCNFREIINVLNKIANIISLKLNEIINKNKAFNHNDFLSIKHNLISLEEVYDLLKEQRQINIDIGNDYFNILNPKDIKEDFNSIKGSEEAKMQIKELINLFTNPTLSNIGLEKPKGLLLYGLPGTGKTMMAKAIAKEINMPFISLSGSSFVEKYVGVGAKRVRQLFDKARKYKPCIIYIDEIDAIGSRNSDNNSERDSVINELLIQLDGSKNNEGIFVIGSTNHLNKIDHALIRAGRFDRKIEISLPYLEGRKEIILELLKKFTINLMDKNVLISQEDFINKLAKMTVNFSPAEIKNLFNQAAVIAIRNGKEKISLDDLRLANEEIQLGIKTVKQTEENKKTTAYHESGHAVLGHILEHADPVRRVTITPRADSLGVTYSYPEEDRTKLTKENMLDDICMTLGGRAAEEIFIGKISTGASGDIKQVTQMANSMITKYGFAEDEYLSMVLYNDVSKLSDKTKEKIEQEVLRIIKEQYQRALKLLKENEDKVHNMATLLLEYEVIDEEEIISLFN